MVEIQAIFKFGKIHVVSTTNIILRGSLWNQALHIQNCNIAVDLISAPLRGRGSLDKDRETSGSLKILGFSIIYTILTKITVLCQPH